MLQELAGIVTPFTARVRQEAERQVAEERARELAAQARDHEERIQGLRAEMTEQNRREVRERLMRLAGYGQSRGGMEREAGQDA